MDLSETLSNAVRRIFDNGLDEVLVFAIVFLFILFTNRDDEHGSESGIGSILPIVLIGVFLIFYSGFARKENMVE